VFPLLSVLVILRFIQRKKSAPSSPPPSSWETIPQPISSQRTAVQYSELLPQVHLTLVSVFQGVAIAILVSRFDDVDPLRLPGTIYYLASLMVVVLIWFMYSWGFVTFSYPLHAWRTLLEFTLMAAEVFAFAFVGNPPRWAFGIAATALAGGCLRLLNIHLAHPSHYEQPDMHRSDNRREGAAAWSYMLFALAVAGAGVAYQITSSMYLRVILPLGVGAIATFFLGRTHAEVARDIATLLTPSPWRYDEWRQILKKAP
jgi:hypothetical protein